MMKKLLLGTIFLMSMSSFAQAGVYCQCKMTVGIPGVSQSIEGKVVYVTMDDNSGIAEATDAEVEIAAASACVAAHKKNDVRKVLELISTDCREL